MAYQLKGVWSTIGTPTFENQADFELAKQLAGMNPYNLRWDESGRWFDAYRGLYGDSAVDSLEKSRIAGQGNGLLVLSFEKKWTFPEAVFIEADPVPQPQPGPDEEIVKTPWGDFIRKKAAKAGGLTTADVEQIAARVTRDILKALGIITA